VFPRNLEAVFGDVSPWLILSAILHWGCERSAGCWKPGRITARGDLCRPVLLPGGAVRHLMPGREATSRQGRC
jgi:hypothetical protein